jgi:hypothetical protein
MGTHFDGLGFGQAHTVLRVFDMCSIFQMEKAFGIRSIGGQHTVRLERFDSGLVVTGAGTVQNPLDIIDVRDGFAHWTCESHSDRLVQLHLVVASSETTRAVS